eukprot:TRINITY_DN1584_c0_g2_i1.p1 TRINITY_DN1584_c0_g2~~TRINITY_DN1584_c0_g2_i1.p1  ORF type:complete len:495 (+),score=101.00 TRINITY_DN1584_c0_g2_i1:39-1523(+)
MQRSPASHVVSSMALVIAAFASFVGLSVAEPPEASTAMAAETDQLKRFHARHRRVVGSHHHRSQDASSPRRHLRGHMPHFFVSHHRQQQKQDYQEAEGQQQGQEQGDLTDHVVSPCDSISKQMRWAVSDPVPLNTSQILHSLHPSVGGAMGSMEGQLRELQNSHSEMGRNLTRFVEASGDADLHMNDVIELRRRITAEHSILRAHKRRFKKLDAEARRLNITRNQLRLKLRAVMDTKVAAAEGRLEKQKKLLNETDSVVRNLSSVRDQYKELALKKLETRRKAQKAFEQAEVEVEEARKKLQNASTKVLLSKSDAIKGKQAYKYVNTRFRAEKSRQKWVEERAILSNKSLARMQSILNMEEVRLEKAFVEGEQRLKNKVAEEKAAENKTSMELQDAETEYAEWQASQKQRAKEEAAKKAAYAAALKTYGERRQKLLKAAQDKAGASAVRRSDWKWDDWAWSGPDVSDSLQADSTFDDADPLLGPAPAPAVQAAS